MERASRKIDRNGLDDKGRSVLFDVQEVIGEAKRIGCSDGTSQRSTSRKQLQGRQTKLMSENSK